MNGTLLGDGEGAGSTGGTGTEGEVEGWLKVGRGIQRG